MESSLDSSKQVEHVFLYKEFEKICPYFISIGMSYEQFWYEDVEIAQTFLKAFEIKEKRRAIERKWTLWEQGLYIYEALCDVSPILRAFSKVKKPLQYPTKPYDIEELEEKFGIKQEEKQKEKEKLEVMKAQIFFENWAKATKEKFAKKGG